ncbi:hypothetical protein HMPREF9018_0714 [Prevotella amnii CRIS 21A-A]|uniref:Uncharacterized protein n=1 Tax=Prevotella amnii CRIS 21A-A TaxID=679191 RepID=E1GWZ4_9BACT|nr:hypothetical protein HMPREF9018_0714 [Prevotella amnii CRIS 21A-A]
MQINQNIFVSFSTNIILLSKYNKTAKGGHSQYIFESNKW